MAADRIELVPAGAQTGNGASAWFDVNTAMMAMVGVDITAQSASAFCAYLEGSDDGGTTAYELPVDFVLISTGTATQGATTGAVAAGATGTTGRNIVSVVTAGKYVGIYKHLPTDRIRLVWKITGTSVTFSASAVVK